MMSDRFFGVAFGDQVQSCRSSQHDNLWIGALELAQQPVAALHGGVQRRLCRFLAADVMLFPPVQVRLGSNSDLGPRLS
jgi:hypothetical protein